MGVDASLRRFSLTDEEHPFIGLRNYQRILTDVQFLWVVLPNTFFFMLASVAGGVVLGLAIAMLLKQPFPGRTLVRTLIVFPLMVAPVVASIMIAWIFNDQFGVANAIVTTLGFPPVAWLVKPWLSLCIVVLTDVWLQTPVLRDHHPGRRSSHCRGSRSRRPASMAPTPGRSSGT